MRHLRLTPEWLKNWTPSKRKEVADTGCAGLFVRSGSSGARASSVCIAQVCRSHGRGAALLREREDAEDAAHAGLAVSRMDPLGDGADVATRAPGAGEQIDGRGRRARRPIRP